MEEIISIRKESRDIIIKIREDEYRITKDDHLPVLKRNGRIVVYKIPGFEKIFYQSLDLIEEQLTSNIRKIIREDSGK